MALGISPSRFLKGLPPLTETALQATKRVERFDWGVSDLNFAPVTNLYALQRDYQSAEQMLESAIANKRKDRIRGVLITAVLITLVAAAAIAISYIPTKTQISIMEHILDSHNGLWASICLIPIVALGPFVPSVKAFNKVRSSRKKLENIALHIPEKVGDARQFFLDHQHQIDPWITSLEKQGLQSISTDGHAAAHTVKVFRDIRYYLESTQIQEQN